MDVREIQATQSAPRSAAASNASGRDGFSTALKQAAVQGPTRMDDMFARASAAHGVPVNLLKAVAKAESAFRPDVTSRCGAMGVMQLMPGTAKALGVTDPYDAEQNIMGGAKYLGDMLRRYNGDTSLALAAYNAGSGSVQKYGGIPPYPETQNYVRKVLGYLGQNLGTIGAAPARTQRPVGVSGETYSGLDLEGVGSLSDLMAALDDQKGTTSPQQATQIYNVLRPLLQSQIDGSLAERAFYREDEATEEELLQQQMRFLSL